MEKQINLDIEKILQQTLEKVLKWDQNNETQIISKLTIIRKILELQEKNNNFKNYKDEKTIYYSPDYNFKYVPYNDDYKFHSLGGALLNPKIEHSEKDKCDKKENKSLIDELNKWLKELEESILNFFKC